MAGGKEIKVGDIGKLYGRGEIESVRVWGFPFLFFLSFLWPCCTACGILVPRPGIEPTPPALEAWSPNHWMVREVPGDFLFEIRSVAI